jgi:hypothetical protein
VSLPFVLRKKRCQVNQKINIVAWLP